MDAIMLRLGYSIPPVILYQFQLPNEGLDFGLRTLANDDDVLNLSKYVAEMKLLRVFTQHGATNLLSYFISPQTPPSGGVEPENAPVLPLKPGSVLAPENVMCHTPEFSRSRGWKPQKGSSSCSRNLLLELEDANVEQAVMVNTIQSDQIHVPLSDEMMQQIENFDPFYGYENHQNEEDESDDSDFVDEDNIIEDVEVDMSKFHMSVDMDVEYMGMNQQIMIEKEDDNAMEDVEVINNDAWDSLEEDSDNDRKRRAILKNLAKEQVCSHGEIHKATFYLGQKYTDKKELKDKIDLHALETRRNLMFEKNDKYRLTVVCHGNVPVGVNADVGEVSKRKGKAKKIKSKSVDEGKSEDEGKVKCNWRLHASRATVDDYFVIKTYQDKHLCLTTRNVRSCTATFISKQIVDQVEVNPAIPIRALQDQLVKQYRVRISNDKVFRAKAAATKMVIGDYTKQYALLRDYALELKSTNPDTTVRIDVETEPNLSSLSRQFKRIYVCIGALKQGFKAGLRDFVGLDGTFMKGPFSGVVLTAVGLDANNGIYPLAYALVEKENHESWKWFLEILGEDLDLDEHSNFTFISDRQKGLMNVIENLYPAAQHMYCLRHIYENMRKTWKPKEYKDYLWKCATAPTMQEFRTIMTEFGQYDIQAHDWLMKIGPQHWARSHFTGRAVSDMLLNNVCEVLNSKLDKGRDKPIITSLEFIREYLMKRICTVLKVIKKSKGPLTPAGTRILENNSSIASQYNARFCGASKYEVQGSWQDQHVVDMVQRTCTCRKWELIGIPCKHAIATINEMNDNGEKPGEPYTFAHKVYWLDTWKTQYSYFVEPIKGRVMWPKSDCPTTLTPPPHHKLPGRPKKKRRQSEDERRDRQSQSQSQGTSRSKGESHKLTRKFVTVKCGKCGNKGHNARSCKGQGAK